MGSGLSRQLEAFRSFSVCKKVVHGVGCGGRAWGIVKRGLVALLLAAIIFAPTLGLGVVESRVSAAPVPNAAGWEMQNSPAPSVDFSSIWGDSSNSVFAVGSNGTVIRYDGTAWSVFDAVPLPRDLEFAGIYDIWYSSPSQLFFVGGYRDDDYFYGVYQYDRGVWTKTWLAGGDDGYLQGIWGTSPSDVFVVGGEVYVSGYILHYNGDSWTDYSYSPELMDVAFYDVWGTSSSNVFAVGGYPYGGSAVFRYDGLSWQAMNIGTSNTLLGVWGSSSSNVFAVGWDGTILRFNGSTWVSMDSGTTAMLHEIWGSSPTDVYVIGWDWAIERSIVLHYDGIRWSPVDVGTTARLNGIWGSSASDIFIVGSEGTILHYGGTASPGVATNPATSITQTSATLNGYLTGLGTASSVEVSFEWGLTTAYGSTTPVQTMTRTGAFSATISGLTPGATYHFRAKAMGGTTVYGADRTFTTPVDSVSPSISTDLATSITQTSATLNGNLTSLGSASSAQVSFEWGLTTAYGTPLPVKTMNATGAFSATISGLTPGTTYHFRAKAEGAGAYYGGDMTFTTASTPVLPPTVTTNAATGAGMDFATLNGTLTSLGSAASVQVSLEWGLTASYGSTTPAKALTATGRHSADLTGLAAGTTYHYRAKAVGDDTAYGDDMTFTTSTTPTTPPAVGTEDADRVTANSARLNGNLTSLGTASSATVSFVWGTTQGGPYTNETAGAARTAAGAFRFDLSGLASGATFYYQAKAVGNGTSYGIEKSFTTPASTGGPPSIGTLVADNGRPGDDLTLTIAGSNLTGATAVSFGAGIIVNEFRVVSDTEITAKIAIGTGAEAGDRDVTVATPQGTGTTPGAFKVNEVGSKVHLWVYLVAVAGALAVLGVLAASVGLLLRRRLAH